MRIAVALIEGQIDIHEALIYQKETTEGKHTAQSGIFLRDFPGRLLLYPLQASTCAIIFFGGDLKDGCVAAICGLCAALLEWFISWIGGDVKILLDLTVGTATGVIGGIWYQYHSNVCLRSIFLGTLYWFFYGTAFVIGILEIIAGELETGVTRFIAVSVKTFVLSLGAALGLMLAARSSASEIWFESTADHCNTIDLKTVNWRIPLYLLCSASALGQYRFPVVQYPRGLAVQLAAYEVQYRVQKFLENNHLYDKLDSSASNIAGAAVGVFVACYLSSFRNVIKTYYTKRILQKANTKNTKSGTFVFNLMKTIVKIFTWTRLGRQSDFDKLEMRRNLQRQREELNDPNHPRQEIVLKPKDEDLILETIVGAQHLNVWSVLMPALYQLVPGSIIAQLWFDSIFPPPAVEGMGTESVFGNLMVISTSLALGLIIGFVWVQFFNFITKFFCCRKGRESDEEKNANDRLTGMYTSPENAQDDPESLGVLYNKDVDVDVDVGPDVSAGGSAGGSAGPDSSQNEQRLFPISSVDEKDEELDTDLVVREYK